MSPVERCVADLTSALRVRGPARRRFVAECREHLRDACVQVGEQAAVRSFGSPAQIAAAFDAEVAARQAVRATYATAAGVLATGGSTLALIDASAAGATAAGYQAATFFVLAQLAAVAVGVALLQARGLRRASASVSASASASASPAHSALLARRNGCALVAAGATMLVAGSALPGHGPAAVLLAGPALAGVALVAVLRVRRLTRQLDSGRDTVCRGPLDEVTALSGRQMSRPGGGGLLALTLAVSALGAYGWALGEQESSPDALATASVEVAAVVACYLVLGPALGLRRARARPR